MEARLVELDAPLAPPDRVLVVVPHYYSKGEAGGHGSQRDPADVRARALSTLIASLHDHFNCRTVAIERLGTPRPLPANERIRYAVEIAVITTADRHLLDALTVHPSLFQHLPCETEPLRLGFEAGRVLRERGLAYDYSVYLEDDLVIEDPLFFWKLDWFESLAGKEALLLPQRYESTLRDGRGKAYVDGPLVPEWVAPFEKPNGGAAKVDIEFLGRPITFRRTLNPHSGCYALSRAQLAHALDCPAFLDEDASFVGPLESAATLAILRTFHLFKPDFANASFIEVRHFGESNLLEVVPSAPHPMPAGPSPARLAALESEILRLEEQHYRIQRELDNREEQLRAIQQSRVWALTRPWRTVGTFVKNVLPHRGADPTC